MKSIKTKFVVILGVIVGIMCAGMGIILYFNAKNALTVVAQDLMVQTATESSKVIENKISYQFGIMNTIASMDLIKDSSIPNETKAEYLKKVAAKEGYDSFGIGDAKGSVYTLGGVVIDLSQREYYQYVLKDHQLVTDPIISKADGRLIVNYAVPIKNDQGTVTGVLIGSRLGDELSKMTNDIQMADSGKAYMVNKAGVTVAHYDQQMVTDQVNLIDITSSDPALKDLGIITQHIINGENGFGSYTYQGISKYVAYAPVVGTNWFLAIAVPQKEILSTLNTQRNNVIVITLIVLLLVITTIYIVINTIVKQIKAITSQLDQFAKGDFSVRQTIKLKKHKDEIGEACNSLEVMKESISSMIKEIQSSSGSITNQSNGLTTVSQQMSSASENISFSIQETSKGINSQAEGLAAMSGILNSFGEKLDNIVRNIHDIDSNSKEINVMSNHGNDNMKQLISSVNTVSSAFNDFTAKITNLSHSIEQVNEISNVIDGIAEQTSLLSLNASIEAARAGEFGKGFAVVASEIGKLADQSQRSAQSINNLISNISGDASVIIDTTEGLNKELELQISSIKTAIESYRNIVDAINSIGSKIQTVNGAAGEINHEKTHILDKITEASSVAEEVSASSEEIASAAQELTASSEEVAYSAEQLNSMTKNMQELVSKFVLE